MVNPQHGRVLRSKHKNYNILEKMVNPQQYEVPYAWLLNYNILEKMVNPQLNIMYIGN